MPEAKGRLLITLLLRNTPTVLFVVIFLIFSAFSPLFFRYENLESIATQASYLGIATIGMTVVLVAGGIDLSIGSTMYLSAAVAGLLTESHGVPVFVALAVALGIGLLFGAVNAFCIVKLKIIPFLTTLATLTAGRGFGLLITRSHAVYLPRAFTNIGSTRLFGIPLPIVLFGFTVLICQVLLKRTPVGRHIYAVGSDADEARKAGLRVENVQALVYVLSGVLAATGGIISVSQMGSIMAGFAEGIEFKAVAATVLGGTSLYGGIGSVFPGVVIGVILIQMIQAGLVYMQVDLYVEPLITGGIIFAAVFIDSLRKLYIQRLERRNIRIEP